MTDSHTLAGRFLDVIEHDIVPLTRAGVERGDKVFGAAILRKQDLSLVVAGTNQETVNPLHHGEIAALNAWYGLAESDRPDPEACLFLSTHEPCSLCLSAITWAGFDNFTYLFGYDDTRDAFAIPHDLRILEEVFGVKNGGYRRSNSFWKAQSLAELIESGPEPGRAALTDRIRRISALYADLSAVYQSGKGDAGIPLA